MMIMLLMSFIPILFTLLIIMINKIISMKNLQEWKNHFNREKPTPFECGFNPLTQAHLPFSIQFYLIAMIFLIFDIEILIILPFIPSLIMNSNLFSWFLSFLIIYLCLIIGLIYEWNEQSIIWLK
uniref:NADH-ubiquinone oxidoreductase chain 3 n=1 Tax=Dolichovespula panda TaxID=2040468 RepID=A0A291C4W4_9HYME|nr:NADH dehydrogenase subunit 3 [Dolichovespula panda]ATF28545.1 NADH dehydrogenase subunit 3 [Dolichovespula panda]